jgi:hypothetical protein
LGSSTWPGDQGWQMAAKYGAPDRDLEFNRMFNTGQRE